MIFKHIKMTAIIGLTLITLQSIGHSSGLTFKQDPNRVTLYSYDVDIDDDHPAAVDKWRSKPIEIEGAQNGAGWLAKLHSLYSETAVSAGAQNGGLGQGAGAGARPCRTEEGG